jgi:hypothetical protein
VSLFFAPAVILTLSLSKGKDPEEIEAASGVFPFQPSMHQLTHSQSPTGRKATSSCHQKIRVIRANPC